MNIQVSVPSPSRTDSSAVSEPVECVLEYGKSIAIEGASTSAYRSAQAPSVRGKKTSRCTQKPAAHLPPSLQGKIGYCGGSVLDICVVSADSILVFVSRFDTRMLVAQLWFGQLLILEITLPIDEAPNAFRRATLIASYAPIAVTLSPSHSLVPGVSAPHSGFKYLLLGVLMLSGRFHILSIDCSRANYQFNADTVPSVAALLHTSVDAAPHRLTAVSNTFLSLRYGNKMIAYVYGGTVTGLVHCYSFLLPATLDNPLQDAAIDITLDKTFVTLTPFVVSITASEKLLRVASHIGKVLTLDRTTGSPIYLESYLSPITDMTTALIPCTSKASRGSRKRSSLVLVAGQRAAEGSEIPISVTENGNMYSYMDVNVQANYDSSDEKCLIKQAHTSTHNTGMHLSPIWSVDSTKTFRYPVIVYADNDGIVHLRRYGCRGKLAKSQDGYVSFQQASAKGCCVFLEKIVYKPGVASSLREQLDALCESVDTPTSEEAVCTTINSLNHICRTFDLAGTSQDPFVNIEHVSLQLYADAQPEIDELGRGCANIVRIMGEESRTGGSYSFFQPFNGSLHLGLPEQLALSSNSPFCDSPPNIVVDASTRDGETRESSFNADDISSESDGTEASEEFSDIPVQRRGRPRKDRIEEVYPIRHIVVAIGTVTGILAFRVLQCSDTLV